MATLEQLLEQYLAAQMAPKSEPVQKAEPQVEYVTPAALTEVLKGFASTLSAEVSKVVTETVAAEVAKAMPVAREQGAGRVGEVATEDPRDANPVSYLAKKAAAAVEAGQPLSDEDKSLAWALTRQVILDGMRAE